MELKKRRHKMLNLAWRGLRRFAQQIKLLALAAALSAPLVGSRTPTTLEQIQSSGKLTIISRNGPTTYYEGTDGLTGFEYQLAKNFAKRLGVELEIVEEEDLNRLLDNVGISGHFAAAGLTVTERRKRNVAFSHPYMSVTQQLIYHAGDPRPSSVEDLIGKHILVVNGSAHAERLRELQKQHPDLVWEERHDVEMLDLLEMVHNRKIDYAVVDSNAYELNSAVYPKAKVAFPISEEVTLAWAFPQSKDTSLLDAANEFLLTMEQSGALVDMRERFYGRHGDIDYNNALVFARRVKERLPQWRDKIKAAAEEHELDWLLMAALSYQESHWDPEATSRTGVRGFMMLTLSTAKEMDVKNRLNPDQSIAGGTRYFRKLLDRIPASVTGQERIWLALAAYNIGYGHLEDARVLAQQHGANPNRWADVKDYLPLLSKRQYYKFTKHGYARGQEAVDYVQNIRNFYTILAWNDLERGQQMTALAMNNKPEPEEDAFNVVISEAIANQQFAYRAITKSM
jgi:membrane-bound lytic murein transglycosylase F